MRPARHLDDAGRRATLEGGGTQRVSAEVPLGSGGFADDLAPDDALVAVPLPPGSDAAALDAVGRAGSSPTPSTRPADEPGRSRVDAAPATTTPRSRVPPDPTAACA